MILGVKEGKGTRSKEDFQLLLNILTYYLNFYNEHVSCLLLKYTNEKHSLNTHLLLSLLHATIKTNPFIHSLDIHLFNQHSGCSSYVWALS